MSVTLAGIVIAAAGEGLKILHQAGWKPGMLLKTAEPVIKDASKKLSEKLSNYQETYAVTGWQVEDQYLKTKLKRTYDLKTKTVWGVNQTVVRYFNSLHNVTVNESYNNGSNIITCKANLPRRMAGLKLDLIVTIEQSGNKITVVYESPTNEIIETVMGWGVSFFVIGAGKLLGQAIRRDIPIELDKAIQEYLNKQ